MEDPSTLNITLIYYKLNTECSVFIITIISKEVLQ